MTEPIDFQQLPTTGEAPATGRSAGDLKRLSAIPVEVSVELGRAQMTVGDTLDLHPGSVVTLNRMAGEAMDLLVIGTPIARGEIVVVDEQFGLRVTEVLGGSGPEPAGGAPSAGAAPAES
jgi:flagellar motor switch protein FliN/FliY